MSKQFIIGKPLTYRCVHLQVGLALRRVRRAQRLVEWRPAARREERRIVPLGQRRNMGDGRAHRLGHRLGGQSFSESVDRLVQWHGIQLVRRQHVIGVRHLELIFVALDLAADDALRANRQRPIQIVLMRMEIDQFDRGRVVGASDAIGLAPVARRDVIEHVDGDRCDAAGFSRDQLRAIRTIDHADRQVEDQIDDPWPRDSRDQLFKLGADAAKRARFGEQGKQNRRTHRSQRIWSGQVVLNGRRGYIRPMAASENGGSSEARRKRLLFRAQRRGFKEVDLIFGTFAAAELATLPEAELDQFEALLIAPDQDVYTWLRGHTPVPAAFDTPLFARLKALCSRRKPKWSA
jgi:antitoxin CptB